jgi:serine/threonine protein kinase
MALSPGFRLGPYSIASELGKGGMGEVFRARDTRLDRDVAIKILPENMGRDPVALRRFERLLTLLKSHPNLTSFVPIPASQTCCGASTSLFNANTMNALRLRHRRGVRATLL